MKGSLKLGRPVSPDVRLSPNVPNLTAPMEKPVNVTLNEQVAARDCASVAEQVTGVVPSRNSDPGAGLHVTVTGAAPPVALGGVKFTACALASTSRTVRSTGQAIAGAAVGGGVGSIGPLPLPPQPTARSSAAAAT
jgi:hypothetical protein